MNSYTQDFINAIKMPSREYGEVPFYWWTGEKLNKPRLTSQLEALAANGVAGVQVNYAHMNGGGENNLQFGCAGRTIPGDPVTFSDEWWDFFGYAAKECERLGMGIGVGDYTLAWLGNGFFTDMIAGEEAFQAQELTCDKITLNDSYIPAEDTLAVIKYEDEDCVKPVIIFMNGKFTGEYAAGEAAFEVRLTRKPLSINPMHPQCGKKLVKIYFEEFERRLPNLKPGTLNYFFQDELSFGCDVKRIWDENLRNGVEKKYGYDPLGFIPHLFFCLGDITAKIRLDVNDVKTTLMENGYFRPVYNFHASRGLVYGCDQSSRGTDPTEFSDYFRTVRWFTAPGNDTPGRASDMRKVKVNSSISHLYRRPRTWLEGYHSSGWGTTLESITAPTGDNFIFGANVLNLHGLYYTTNGGFFEWAPPDFHFRMPYWDDEKVWLKKYNRLAELLTTGKHRCDAAVFYPTASCVADLSGRNSIDRTFETGEFLFSHGLDFDYIDNDSLLKAKCDGGKLHVAGEHYKVLIFSHNDCIHYSVVAQIRSFLACGGIVAFVGSTPSVSDRAGANDSVFLNEINELLSDPNCCVAANNEALISFIDRKITRLFIPDSFDSGKIYSMCRANGRDRLFYIRYAPKDCVCRFETKGKNAYLLDTDNGKIIRMTGAISLEEQTIIKLPQSLPQDILILFTDTAIDTDGTINTSSFNTEKAVNVTEMNGDWAFTVIPTLDNKWGDFYKPAGGIIGLQARFFDCAKVEKEGEIPKKFTYTNLPYCHTQGIRIIKAPGCAKDLAAAISGIEAINTDRISFRDVTYEIETLPVHDRYGIISQENDDSVFEQGYHGLKGRVYDDNFIYSEDSVFLASVYAEDDDEAVFVIGGIKPDVIYLNGKKITDISLPVKLTAGENRIAAAYIYRDEKELFRAKGPSDRGGIYLAKPGYHENDYELSKTDFANDGFYRFGDGGIYAFRFRTAPGFSMMKCNVFGEVLSAYNDGNEMSVLPMDKGNFGGKVYEIRTGNINKGISEVMLYVRAEPGCAYTGVMPEPVDLFCTEGVMSTGDLSLTDSALTTFSGKLVYTKAFTVDALLPGRKFILDAQNVGATLKVEVNGETAAVLTYAPFTADITDFLTAGENTIKLTVSNTLCNHYSTIPSRYSNFPGDAKSGLAGSVTITEYQLS